MIGKGKRFNVIKALEEYLKHKYDIILGELSLTRLLRKIYMDIAEIKASGRSVTTGRKKTITFSLNELITRGLISKYSEYYAEQHRKKKHKNFS